MIQPTLLIGKVYAVEVPEETLKAEIIDKESMPLVLMCYVKDEEGWFKPGVPVPKIIPAGNWQLIGNLKEITEEHAAQIVERDRGGFTGRIEGYKDYIQIGCDIEPYSKAIFSLNSLLVSKGLDLINKNYVLLKNVGDENVDK